MIIAHILTFTARRPLFIAAMQIAAGSLLIALLAQARFPLWFTPVPVTLQTFACMLVGGMFGSKKGMLAAALYLGQVLMGLPVLCGGIANPAALVGITGGYLVGMVFQAYLVGWCMERWGYSWRTAVGFMASIVLQLGLGTVWLGAFVGFKEAFILGCAPFLLGECLKALAASQLCRLYKA